ncbi:hypothetical protein GF327_05660 [Candidatus Woesearchaeota archaeon]|nr:hypothetical protein [Candidatus Woesearchaeota archaeon]
MKNAIITSTDSKFGDFLIKNWLRSLKENVSLKNTEVVILDYGLKKHQKKKLQTEKVVVKKCKRDANVNNIRYRDMADFLKKNKYDQVLSIDGGDIIFQKDISSVFLKNKTDIRIVCEGIKVVFWKFYFFHKSCFSKNHGKKIKEIINSKKIINSGVIFGPHKKMEKLFYECFHMINDKTMWGRDQLAINYLLYRDGFKEISKIYNFLPWSFKDEFFIKDRVFYLNDKIIPIFHNAGRFDFLRPVENFGYKQKHSRKKKMYHLLKPFVKI